MPDSPDMLAARAAKLIGLNRYADAVPILAKVLAGDPSHHTALCEMAICQIELGEHAEAVKFAEKAIEASPEHEWGHGLRALALKGLGRNRDALVSAREAHRLEPENPGVMNTLAHMLLENKLLDEAKSLALRMREADPDLEHSHVMLGNVYLEMGDNLRAAESYEQALKIDPLSPTALNNLGVAKLRGLEKGYKPFFNAGVLSIKDEPPKDGSLDHFTEAIKLDPNNALAARNIRVTHDYSFPFYSFIALIPFVVASFLVVPFAAILGIIGLVYGLGRQLWEIWRKRRALSTALKILIKSARPNGLGGRVEEFLDFCSNLFKRTAKPHLLLAAAVVICHAPVFETSPTGTRTWNQGIAFVMALISFYWLSARLTR